MTAPRSTRRSALAGVLLSVSLHLGIGFLAGEGETPEFAFEFELPMEVELGMSDEMSFEGHDSTEAAAPETEPETAESASSDDGMAVDAGVDAGPPDAGPPDAGPPDAGPPDAGPEDAGPEDGGAAEDAAESLGTEGEGTGRIPPGAQLAVRLDMSQIRASTLAPQVINLLNAIPDWALILEGSGVDPVADLDRLMIASPNLQRARFVIAGRHAHPDQGRAYIEGAVQQMADARGRRARWRQEEGVSVVDWHNVDQTARVLAIVGPNHFTISRAQDLRRVLAIAQARAEREEEEAEEAEEAEDAEDAEDEEEEGPSGAGADALLSMGATEALSFEAEGVRNFVQRSPRGAQAPVDLLPDRFRLGLSDSGSGVSLEGTAFYDNEEAAEAALTFWTAEKDRFASQLGILRGGGVVRSIQLSRDGSNIEMRLSTSYMIATVAIGQVIGRLSVRRQNRRAPSTMTGTMGSRTGMTGMGATGMDATGMDATGMDATGMDATSMGSTGSPTSAMAP